jgi:hypothetical protein
VSIPEPDSIQLDSTNFTFLGESSEGPAESVLPCGVGQSELGWAHVRPIFKHVSCIRCVLN